MGLRLALRILPPSEPITNMFWLIRDWFMARPLTGTTSPSFLLSIRNPFIGYRSTVFDFWELEPSSLMDSLGTSQRRILPSVPKERML